MNDDDFEIEDAVDADDLADLFLMWSDGLGEIEHALEAAIAEASDGSVVELGGARLAGGELNGCPVARLVRVEFLDCEGSRLAEPTPRAVSEAVLSLMRGK